MSSFITSQTYSPKSDNCAILIEKSSPLSAFGLSTDEENYIKSQVQNEQKLIPINKYSHQLFFYVLDIPACKNDARESARKAGFEVCSTVNKLKINELGIAAAESLGAYVAPFAEGIALSNYQFLKYFTDKDKKENSLTQLGVGSLLSAEELLQLNAATEGTMHARRLIAEPVIHMTAVQLSKEIEALGKETGFAVEVFDKAKIEELKMGGLLAVNSGSFDPPTFSILRWEPENAVNEKTIAFVGKGVVFDTGGLSLKPTPNSMDMMKADMGGAAAVIGTMYAIAKAKLPVKVIAFVPATDNRPGSKAYTPGDVIKMYNGLTVEVLNTDAEGRMIMADALSYADEFDPELVIDVATLTGAAARAIGKEASVVMGTASDDTFEQLRAAGSAMRERAFRFPFWDEYAEQIKSDIADLKNVGGPEGGAITAGKFLQRFVKTDWIHIDIAGPMWSSGVDSYRGKAGSGVGVRMLFEFLRQRAAQ